MKKYYQLSLTGLAFIIVLSSAVFNVNGPGGGYSNAPSESNCATACHGGSIITSGNSNLNNLRLGGNFTGNGYIPDSSYTVEITFKQTGKSKFGLQVTALDKNNDLAGTFTNTGSRTSKTTASPVTGKTREYIQHTASGTANVGTDSTRWTFTWKAPSANIGELKFYVVVMAANGNSTNDPGDIVYGKVFTLAPSSLLPVAKATSNDTLTCTGYNVQLSGGGSNSPTSYSWRFTGITSPTTSTAQNPVLNYSTSGTKLAILTVKNSKGFSQPDTLRIVVNTSPTASITTASPQTICEGDSIQISANSGANINYLWLHNNKTTQRVYVKDTGNYRVKVTSTLNQCARTSAPFRLNLNPKPIISLSQSSSEDSFCGSFQQVYTATGSNIDSIHWYVNGKLTRRGKNLSEQFSGTLNSSIYAVAKSSSNCVSAPSNSFSVYIVPRLYHSGFLFTKTTSEIDLNWTPNPGITQTTYSLNGSAFSATDTDSGISLSGLQPNTTYSFRIRAHQNGPCLYTDTVIDIKTSACSNLLYTIDAGKRICRGEDLTVNIGKLYAARYSVSFNGNPYSTDTMFVFKPLRSDTLRISIIDSLSPTCPPILETMAYTVDTFPNNDSALQRINHSSCSDVYSMQLNPDYPEYAYYRNGQLEFSGSQAAYTFESLQTGDVLLAKGIVNTCSRDLQRVEFTLNPSADAGFGFVRNWKTYTFTADEPGNAVYLWRINGDSAGNAATLVKNMEAYNNSTVSVALTAITDKGCKDSVAQNIVVPELSGLPEMSGSGFSVYPNPFTQKLYVKAAEGVYSITVFDELGREVYSVSDISRDWEIPVSEWSSGLYQIRIQTESAELFVRKMLKSE